jgi:ectonucleotide pyrophosphatase/phosphodiesterase family protein 5
MKLLRRVLCACSLLLIAGCAQMPRADLPPLLVLMSLDGFRTDYLNQEGAHNLRALAKQGMRAETLEPSFPSTTFPNHYTIVTGLRPDRHGVVGHAMEDPFIPGERFSAANEKAMTDPRWRGQAEPVWISAEKAGIRTGLMMWPGSEAPIQGVLAHDRRKFDDTITADARIDTVLGWLDGPPQERPRLLGIYFTDVDKAGHAFGPDSSQVAESVARVDTALGRLIAGLRTRGIAANIVVVSDHGMAETSPERVIRFNRIAPPTSYRLIATVPYAGIDAMPGQEKTLAAALLTTHEHMQCWRRGAIPMRFHYGHNRRVPQFVCLADVGWVILPGADGERFPKGTHGYDNAAPEMQAIFIAAGPAFNHGVVVPSFSNVNVYSLLTKLLALPALPADGSLAPFAPGLSD